jgi:Peptidase MA superfamily
MRRPTLVLALSLLSAPLAAQTKPNNSVANELAVQSALQQGRRLLNKGDANKAVELLEAKLAIINGNTDYLAVLRDAYVAYLRDLQLTKQDAQILEVTAKLKALDPTFEPAAAQRSDAPLLPPVGPSPKARAKGDPFQQTPLLEVAGPGELARRGDDAFAQKLYTEAANSYRQAAAADPKSLGSSKSKWAYCRINAVVEQLKTEPADANALAALEREVALAMVLAEDKPDLVRFGRDVLNRVRQRQGLAPVAAAAPADGWNTEESVNFRLFHHHTNDFAQKLLQQAERARTAAIDKWYGGPSNNWEPRCDLYLHATAGDYARATGKDFRAAGHATLEVVDRRVVKRRIDLAADNPDLLPATIPHEVTHVVLTDLFPDPMLPRWADEAMAILAEPRENVARYLQVLPKVRNSGKMFAVGQLLTTKDFPEAAAVTAFYVQSVSLVDWLVAEKGPQNFSLFMQAAQRYGVEKALEKSYGIRGFSDLQQRWQRKTFAQSEKPDLPAAAPRSNGNAVEQVPSDH